MEAKALLDIEFQLKGLVKGKETSKVLEGVEINLKCSYEDKNKVEKELNFKSISTKEDGKFEFAKKITIAKDSNIECEINMEYD